MTETGSSGSATLNFPPIAAAGFASMLSMRACDALLPEFASSFQVSTGDAAAAVSFFVIAYGILQLVYGPLGDRYGKHRVITWAVMSSALINVALMFAPSMTVVSMLRGLAGAAAAGVIPLCIALIGDAVSYEERQGVLARFMSATILGMICGQWMGGVVADLFNWQSAFLLLAGIFGVAGLLLLRSMPTHGALAANSVAGSYLSQVRGVLRMPWARAVLFAALVEGAAVFSAIVFIPTHLHATFGLPLSLAGAVVAIYGAGGLAYTFLARYLLTRIGEQGLASAGGVLLAVGFAMLAFGPHWLWSLPACFISGLGFYMMHNTLQANATQMAPASRGTAVSLFAASLFLGQSLGIVVVSAVVDRYGLPSVFMASMLILPVLGAWLAWGISRKAASRQ